MSTVSDNFDRQLNGSHFYVAKLVANAIRVFECTFHENGSCVCAFRRRTDYSISFQHRLKIVHAISFRSSVHFVFALIFPVRRMRGYTETEEIKTELLMSDARAFVSLCDKCRQLVEMQRQIKIKMMIKAVGTSMETTIFSDR